jgi:hypothetical protein
VAYAKPAVVSNNAVQEKSPGIRSISIKAMSAGGVSKPEQNSKTHEIEEEIGIDQSWNEPVTDDALRKCWLAFANRIEAENPRFYSILTNHLPRLNNTVLQLELKNSIQETEVMAQKYALFTYLKTELRNARLTLEVCIAKNDEPASKAYTAADKFKLMLESNPSLLKLSKHFDLDLD